MRPSVLVVLALFAFGATDVPAKSPASIPVNCAQPLAEPCAVRHGRLSTQNGITPTIWVVGTTRRLHVTNEEASFLPASVLPYLEMTSADHGYIFGDFLICPIEPDVAGHMRDVCVADAKKLVVQNAMNRWPPFRVRSTWLANQD